MPSSILDFYAKIAIKTSICNQNQPFRILGNPYFDTKNPIYWSIITKIHYKKKIFKPTLKAQFNKL